MTKAQKQQSSGMVRIPGNESSHLVITDQVLAFPNCPEVGNPIMYSGTLVVESGHSKVSTYCDCSAVKDVHSNGLLLLFVFTSPDKIRSTQTTDKEIAARLLVSSVYKRSHFSIAASSSKEQESIQTEQVTSSEGQHIST